MPHDLWWTRRDAMLVSEEAGYKLTVAKGAGGAEFKVFRVRDDDHRTGTVVACGTTVNAREAMKAAIEAAAHDLSPGVAMWHGHEAPE